MNGQFTGDFSLLSNIELTNNLCLLCCKVLLLELTVCGIGISQFDVEAGASWVALFAGGESQFLKLVVQFFNMFKHFAHQ